MTRLATYRLVCMKRKQFLTALASAVLALQAPTFAQAQSWPNKPIRIIVPFAPGGNVDVTARVVGTAMGRVLNQSVIV